MEKRTATINVLKVFYELCLSLKYAIPKYDRFGQNS